MACAVGSCGIAGRDPGADSAVGGAGEEGGWGRGGCNGRSGDVLLMTLDDADGFGGVGG